MILPGTPAYLMPHAPCLMLQARAEALTTWKIALQKG